MIGATFRAKRITHSGQTGIAKYNTTSLGGLQRVLRALRDHLAFVLCHRRQKNHQALA
jgi:hypothetical protein